MASEHDGMLTDSDREEEQVRQLLAWYQSPRQCWTLVESTEGSGHQDRMASQCQPRRGESTQKLCFANVLDGLLERVGL